MRAPVQRRLRWGRRDPRPGVFMGALMHGILMAAVVPGHDLAPGDRDRFAAMPVHLVRAAAADSGCRPHPPDSG